VQHESRARRADERAIETDLQEKADLEMHDRSDATTTHFDTDSDMAQERARGDQGG
jgi:hypothetical protein